MNKMEKEREKKTEKNEEWKIVKRNSKKTEKEESLSIQDQVVVRTTEKKITFKIIFLLRL